MNKDGSGIWIDAKDHLVSKRDEKAMLSVYRVIKIYWQFFVGLVIGFLLGLGVFK